MSTMKKRLVCHLGVAAMLVGGVALAESTERTASVPPGSASDNAQGQRTQSHDPMAAGDQKQGLNARGEQSLGFVRYSDIDDVQVRSPDNKDLGTISDVIIRRDSGDIRYLVLRRGGVLGVGAKDTAVPFRAFETIARDEDGRPRLLLNITPQQLEQAPDFDAQEFPGLQYTAWRQRMNQYYQQISADWMDDEMADAQSWRLGLWDSGASRDVTPTGERREGRAAEASQAARDSQAVTGAGRNDAMPQAPDAHPSQAAPAPDGMAGASDKVSARLCLLSQFHHSDLQSQAGNQDIGDVEDLLVELDAGKTAFLIVDPSDSVTEDGSNRLVPFAAVSLGADEKVHLSGPTDALSTAAVAPEDLRRLSDESFRKGIYQGFGVSAADFRPRSNNGQREAYRDEDGRHVRLTGQVVRVDKNTSDQPGQVSTLILRGQDGQERTIEIDPARHQGQDLNLNRGDQVTVDAVRTSRDGRTVYKAAVIWSGDRELRFSGVQEDNLSRYE